MKTLKATLHIGRALNSRDDATPIRIEVTDKSSHCTAVEIRMSLADFAEAVTGLGFVPCVMTFNDSGVIGKVAEHKSEVVWIPELPHPYDSPKALAIITMAFAAFEVDGWRGDRSDASNHHRVVRREPPAGAGRGSWRTITFRRHVEAQP